MSGKTIEARFREVIGPVLREQERKTWIRGFVTGLCEMHRLTHDSRAAREVARHSGNLTIAEARDADVIDLDLEELKKAGIP